MAVKWTFETLRVHTDSEDPECIPPSLIRMSSLVAETHVGIRISSYNTAAKMLLLTIGELLSHWNRALSAVFLADCPVSKPLQPIWNCARKIIPHA